jgi:hypothetical protein
VPAPAGGLAYRAFPFLIAPVRASRTVVAGGALPGAATGRTHSVSGRVLSEGFTIIGWVAMWRPLEIYLYRWWPVRQLGRVYRKLGAADVVVRVGDGNS